LRRYPDHQPAAVSQDKPYVVNGKVHKPLLYVHVT
jgi:hypothetical protein